jgi:hypothetical protein
MTEKKGFVLKYTSALKVGGEGIVRFGVEGTDFQTQWSTDEAIKFANEIASCAYTAAYQEAVYRFMIDIFQMSEIEAANMLAGISMYDKSTDEEKAEMRADAKQLIPPRNVRPGRPKKNAGIPVVGHPTGKLQ